MHQKPVTHSTMAVLLHTNPPKCVTSFTQGQNTSMLRRPCATGWSYLSPISLQAGFPTTIMSLTCWWAQTSDTKKCIIGDVSQYVDCLNQPVVSSRISCECYVGQLLPCDCYWLLDWLWTNQIFSFRLGRDQGNGSKFEYLEWGTQLTQYICD